MSDIRINIHGGEVEERTLLAAATRNAINDIGFHNVTLKNNPDTIDPLYVTDTRTLLDLAMQGRPDLFTRPIIIDTTVPRVDDLIQKANQTCERLLDSEEHAVESAIPSVAYDAVEVIHGLISVVKLLPDHQQQVQQVEEAKATLHEMKDLIENLSSIFQNEELSTDEKLDQLLVKYPDVQVV